MLKLELHFIFQFQTINNKVSDKQKLTIRILRETGPKRRRVDCELNNPFPLLITISKYLVTLPYCCFTLKEYTWTITRFQYKQTLDLSIIILCLFWTVFCFGQIDLRRYNWVHSRHFTHYDVHHCPILKHFGELDYYLL